MVIKLKYSNGIFDLYMGLSHKTNHILEQDKMQGKERGGGMGTFMYLVKVLIRVEKVVK